MDTTPNNNAKKASSFFSTWLETLQQESWQLELLISGFALFGIWSSYDLVIELKHLLESFFPFGVFVYFAAIVAWRIFFINLLIHVILRGLWIGSIGLRYVSEEIDYEALNYNEYFDAYFKKKIGRYDEFIEKLEKFCSILFSYTFLLFLFFLSAFSFLLFNFLLNWIFGLLSDVKILEDYETILGTLVGLVIIFHVLFGAIVFIDFMTMGGLRRIKDKTFTRFYAPIFKYFSLITLSFLYRPILYNFIDYRFTRVLFYLSFPYIFILALFDGLFVHHEIPHFPKKDLLIKNGLLIQECYYEDLYVERIKSMDPSKVNDWRHLHEIQLSNYKISDPYPSFFLKANGKDQFILSNKYELNPVWKAGLRWNLFTEEEAIDSHLVELTRPIQNEYKELREHYVLARDSIESSIDSLYIKRERLRIDSLTKIKDSLVLRKKSLTTDYTDKRNDRILDGMQKLATVEIDNIAYNDSLSCFFSRHLNSHEEGIKCNFPITNLKMGPHMFKAEVLVNRGNEELDIDTVTIQLPFIKIF